MTEPIHGVIVVDKPVGPTSFAIVRQARQATGERKIGHGGTLDPLASGVLPLCFGEATKLAQFLLDADKEYEATIGFGVETDTYDAGGVITMKRPAAHLDIDVVRGALARFVGQQAQIPPMYSALKRDGRPLYSYARDGETLDRAPRTVHIHALQLREFIKAPAGIAALPAREGGRDPNEKANVACPSARILIRCSKGTYVRSLAYDLGRAVGTGAHLTALRRTRSGPFGLDGAVRPEALASAPLPVVSPADALAHLATIVVAEDVAWAISRGQIVTWAKAGVLLGNAPVDGIGGPLVRILGPGGHLLAVARHGGAADGIRTLRVFRAFGVDGPSPDALPDRNVEE
jgi:tRNA pseudouridine55 synthase